MLREKFKWRPHENESTEARHRDGAACSSEEGPVMGLERRGCIVWLYLGDQPDVGGIFWVKQSHFR
jgi:hypothetical protein